MKHLLTISILAMACTEFDYSYNLDEYELNVPDGGVYLEIDGDTWLGEYDYRDQPEDGYCGPVAVKNMTWWYDCDVPWEQAAHDLKTNDFDPGFKLWKYCAAACMGEVAGCANTCYEIVIRQVKGTPVSEIKKTLKKYTPDGYELKFTSKDPSMVDEIIYQVSIGNPVMVIETINKGKGHTSVITGFYWDNGELWTSGINTYERSLDDFMRGWSLIDMGNRVEKYVMGKFGMRPFTAMWYEKINP
jgi:hypothetical protein